MAKHTWEGKGLKDSLSTEAGTVNESGYGIRSSRTQHTHTTLQLCKRPVSKETSLAPRRAQISKMRRSTLGAVTRCSGRKAISRGRLCFCEKMSKGASKARAQLARSTGAKVYQPSAIHERMVYCTQAFFFAFRATCGLQPFLQPRSILQPAELVRQRLVQGRGVAAIERVQRHSYRS